MKKVHIVETGTLNEKTNTFQFYRTEPFSSRKKAEDDVNNIIEEVGGTGVEREAGLANESDELITYNCLSTDNNPMKVRKVIKTLEVR